MEVIEKNIEGKGVVHLKTGTGTRVKLAKVINRSHNGVANLGKEGKHGKC